MTHYVKTTEHDLEMLKDWLSDTDIERKYYDTWSGIMVHTGYRWLFEFKNAEDALAFKLRWG